MNFIIKSNHTGLRQSCSILEKTLGQWPHLLVAIGGMHPDQLTGSHQPCPCCNGTDRYRWMNDEGLGGWYCSHCGGKRRQGGGGSGIDMLMRIRNWTFMQAVQQIENYYGNLPFTPAPKQKTPVPKENVASYRHSELERFWLLEIAGQLTDGEGYSPLKAKERHYSKRWAVFASKNYDIACSVILEFETERGITEMPVDMGV